MKSAHDKPVLITGGAGFIGTNVAHALLSRGERVIIYDNLSRPGVERNLEWLHEVHGDDVDVAIADVRDSDRLRELVPHVRHVYHFAAQVAVTTSLIDPREDFAVNLQGTHNVLEAVRACDDPPSITYTSTNKVYGELDGIALHRMNGRYEPVDERVNQFGINEKQQLDFHSPYGCSKGAADQYVHDYCRIFDLSAVVFRLSCIYGPHQCGTEDRGWVAHFLLSALKDAPITLYGDGCQVRDVLFVEDLVEAMLLSLDRSNELRGSIYNIGGGIGNAVGLLEMVQHIGTINGQLPEVRFDAWRAGDQRYYVSDTRLFSSATGWHPRVNVDDGVGRLYLWLKEEVIERDIALLQPT